MQSLVVIPMITSKERVSPHVSKFTKAGQDVICALLGLVLECTDPQGCRLHVKSFWVSCSGV